MSSGNGIACTISFVRRCWPDCRQPSGRWRPHSQPALAPTLYERAARWYESHELLPDAVEAALKAGAFARAADLIEDSLDQRSFRNSYHTLCRWLEQLPDEILQAQPTLGFWYAMSTMFTSLRRTPAAWGRIEPCLRSAEQGFEANGQQGQLGEARDYMPSWPSFRTISPACWHLLVRQHHCSLRTASCMPPTGWQEGGTTSSRAIWRRPGRAFWKVAGALRASVRSPGRWPHLSCWDKRAGKRGLDTRPALAQERRAVPCLGVKSKRTALRQHTRRVRHTATPVRYHSACQNALSAPNCSG